MKYEPFYINNNMTVCLEHMIDRISTFEEFEDKFPDELLNDDAKIGNYLKELLWKYDKDQSTVSRKAGWGRSYVGLIANGQKTNPSRNALIAICLTIGTTVEEVQYILKYAGKAPLYVRRKRDVIIWYGFMKHKTVDEVDDILYERGYELLKSDRYKKEKE